MENVGTMKILLDFLKKDFRYSPSEIDEMARTIDVKIYFMKEHTPKNYQPFLDKKEVSNLRVKSSRERGNIEKSS